MPENARVVAAGNELEDSLAANEIAEPLFDRFAHVNIETTAESWLEWAVTQESSYEKMDYKKENTERPKIHPAIYSYISYKGDEVLRTPYNREHPEPHADPRRWKMASDMLYASNNPNTLRAIVGEELTEDFIYFCKLPTLTIEDVLNGNYTEKEVKSMDMGRKLATVSGLISVDDENMPKVRNFVKKLGAEICKKFEVQWAHGDEERLEQAQNKDGKEKNDASDKSKFAKQGEKETFKQIEKERKKRLQELNKELANKSSHKAGDGIQENGKKLSDIGIAMPLIDWRKLLKQAVKYDEEWTRKNARMRNGYFRHRIEQVPMPETEILLDVSGSVSEVLLKNFLRECKNIFDSSKVKIGCFNTRFHGFTELRRQDDIDNMKFPIGRGTDFDVAVEAFSRRVPNKIIFTD